MFLLLFPLLGLLLLLSILFLGLKFRVEEFQGRLAGESRELSRKARLLLAQEALYQRETLPPTHVDY